MRQHHPIFFFFLTVLLPPAFAQDTNLTKVEIDVKIPYTFGEHTVSAKKVTGKILWNSEKTQITQAEFVLPVSELTNNDKTLVCHLQSSITLDYTKSDFPDDHVCEDDTLPSEGKNAPAYPSITATLAAPYNLGDTAAKIKWTIHGVEKIADVPVGVTLNATKTQFSIRGDWTMKRSDFGIKVKKFLFIDASNKLPVRMTIEGDVQ